MTECRHGLSEDCPACMQATIDDLRAQLASTAQARRGSMAAQWTYDSEAEAYYFAPMQAAPPPYLKQRHVDAIIDIAADGTLAGVELIDNMPPPPSPLPSTHQREDDELSEWKQAASVEAGLRREFMAQVDAAREFVKRHPALTLIDLAEFEAFLKVPAMVDTALSSTNLGSPATGTPSREPTGEYTITPADRGGATK